MHKRAERADRGRRSLRGGGLGLSTKRVVIDVVEETLVENNETFYVQIYEPSGAALVNEARYGRGTITDDGYVPPPPDDDD